jgi:hypothetical protein
VNCASRIILFRIICSSLIWVCLLSPLLRAQTRKETSLWEQGNSIVDGIQHWVGNPNSDHTFRAAWGDALNTVPGNRGPDPVVVAMPVVCFPWFFTIVCQ